MQMNLYIRTFITPVDAQMFKSVLQTKWPEMIASIEGARFRLLYNESTPNVSTVGWEFSNSEVQKEIEALIKSEISKFTKALPNCPIHYSGAVELDFVGRI
mgnify:FL=1|jgi:hypothetical protein